MAPLEAEDQFAAAADAASDGGWAGGRGSFPDINMESAAVLYPFLPLSPSLATAPRATGCLPRWLGALRDARARSVSDFDSDKIYGRCRILAHVCCGLQSPHFFNVYILMILLRILFSKVIYKVIHL